MPKFKVPYSYTLCGTIEVEAESLDAACEMVKENEDLTFENSEQEHSVYGSFDVDTTLAEEINSERKED